MKQKIEYLLVGQGLAGTVLAFEMLEKGIDFRIVSSPEKSKASLVAAGMVNPLVFKRLTKSWMVDELYPTMKTTYTNLESILGEKFYADKKILKPLSEQETELWRERKETVEFSPYIETILDKSPIAHLLEFPAYGLVKNSGFLNLSAFLHAAEGFFRKKQLLIPSEFNFCKEQVTASSFQFDNISFEKLIFCEGYHLKENSIFDFVKLNPVKGEVLELFAPELSEEYILNKKVFVLPIGNKRFKAGSTYDWKDLSEQVTEEGSLSITERVEKLISVEYKIEKHWAGVRPTVSDRRPVLGRHPTAKNIFVFNGLGTKGVMLAPFWAKKMVQYLSELNYSFPKEVNVCRFVK